MQFLVDTHVHIYPFYRVTAALDSLIDNMDAAGGATRVACLTERHDCFLFERLAAGTDAGVADAFDARRESDTVLRLVRRGDGGTVYLVAGQQIVTAENIEVLALAMASRVADGAPAPDTVDAVLGAGGVPVAAWGFGKWVGGRGGVVRDLLARYEPGQMALGDTTMRPHGWATPFIMRAARRRGFKVLAGSDPLPFAGEECRPGSYHCIVDAPGATPVDVVDRLLALPAAAVRPAGSRGTPLAVARRILAHKRAVH